MVIHQTTQIFQQKFYKIKLNNIAHHFYLLKPNDVLPLITLSVNRYPDFDGGVKKNA